MGLLFPCDCFGWYWCCLRLNILAEAVVFVEDVAHTFAVIDVGFVFVLSVDWNLMKLVVLVKFLFFALFLLC